MTTLLLPSLSLSSRAFSQHRQSNPKTPTEFLQLIKRSAKRLPIRSDRSVSIPVMLLRSIESCIQRILSHHCTNTRNSHYFPTFVGCARTTLTSIDHRSAAASASASAQSSYYGLGSSTTYRKNSLASIHRRPRKPF